MYLRRRRRRRRHHGGGGGGGGGGRGGGGRGGGGGGARCRNFDTLVVVELQRIYLDRCIVGRQAALASSMVAPALQHDDERVWARRSFPKLGGEQEGPR